MKAFEVPWQLTLALVFAGGVGLYVLKRGGIAQAASGAGAAVVNAAGAAASGAVGAIGASVGLPTPDETTTDPRVARWLIDNAGYWQASQWSGLPALSAASSLAVGSGQAPPSGTPLAARFANFATYDETQRLLNRYPAPTPDPVAQYDALGNYIGTF